MWGFYLTLLIFSIILTLPFLVVFLTVNFFTLAITNLGFSTLIGFSIVLAILLGSFVNLPLSEKKKVHIEDVRFFGVLKRKMKVRKGLSVNLGGAIIPLFVASILIPNAPVIPLLVTTVAAILVSYKSARVIPGVGVSMPPFFTILTIVFFSIILAPENPEIVAFISGVLGTLIGADLLHLKEVMKTAKSTMVIGGSGVFDGLVLTGILASLLAGL